MLEKNAPKKKEKKAETEEAIEHIAVDHTKRKEQANIISNHDSRAQKVEKCQSYIEFNFLSSEKCSPKVQTLIFVTYINLKT